MVLFRDFVDYEYERCLLACNKEFFVLFTEGTELQIGGSVYVVLVIEHTLAMYIFWI